MSPAALIRRTGSEFLSALQFLTRIPVPSQLPLDESTPGAPGLRIFNPGSPTDRRRQPHGTLGLLQIQDGRLITAAIVPVT